MTNALKPKDAATLIILRKNREVLLGKRSRAHVFMPQKYVFPGGRVDAGDGRVFCAQDLNPDVQQKLIRHTSAARSKALAMAAVRETFEETGLMLGVANHQQKQTRSPSWQAFFEQGFAPTLAPMDYIARAITPPGRPRRFDARFFLVDADHLHGNIRGNGELEDLHWADLHQLQGLELSPITELVLELLKHKLAGNSLEGIPMYRELYGKELIEYH